MRSDKMIGDAEVKNALFDDDTLVDLVGEYGLQATYDAIYSFKATVVAQIREDQYDGWRTARNPEWGPKATALVIRAKARLKLLAAHIDRMNETDKF